MSDIRFDTTTVGIFRRRRLLALVAVILHTARLAAQSEVDAPPAQDSQQQVDFAPMCCRF